MSSLPEDLESLLVGQPPVDWPGTVGAALSSSSTRKQVLVAAAVLLVVALIGGVLVVAGGDDSGDDTATEQLSPTPSPTPSTSESGAPRDPVPAATSTTVTLPADDDCESTAPAEPPMPTVVQDEPGEPNIVKLSVIASCTTLKVGQPLFVRATSTATRDRATRFSSTLTDIGLDEPLNNANCAGKPTPDAGAGVATQVLKGSFSEPGRQQVTVLAASPDACVSTPGAAAVVFEVDVLPDATPTPTVTVTPSPTPTPTPTPTPSATPSPTPTPTPTTTPPSPTPKPTVNPVLDIDSITQTTIDPISPGETVDFSVEVSSNVGRLSVVGSAKGAPSAGTCPPREAYSYTSYRQSVPVKVKMPNKPGQYTVAFVAYPEQGCPPSGRPVVVRSSFVITVV